MKSPMQNEIESQLCEDIHFQIIPSEEGHGWDIRILEEFPETVIRFGAIEFVGTEGDDDEDGQISFNFEIVSTPDDDLSKEDLTFQDFVGRILHTVIEMSISEGTMVAQDQKSGEILTTEEIYDEIDEELEEDEYQSGTDDTEEPTDQ
jgi:hypothetical protein